MSGNILVIASGGGHWDQIMSIRQAFNQHDATYVTTSPVLAKRSGLAVEVIPDCNRHQIIRAIWCALTLFVIILKIRPQAIVTTGALPGLIAIILGKAVGARSLWIDSIANADNLSMSGSKARKLADRCFSQWATVADRSGCEHRGAVL